MFWVQAEGFRSREKDHALIQMHLLCRMTNQPCSPNGKIAPTMLLVHEAK